MKSLKAKTPRAAGWVDPTKVLKKAHAKSAPVEKVANEVPTKIVVSAGRELPKYANDFAACADVYANIGPGTDGAQYSEVKKKYFVQIPSRVLVSMDCGFSLQMPPGWKAVVSARSGWGKQGLIITNAPGQIDEDYRGSVCILLCNVGRNVIQVFDGDRIAQMRPEPVFRFAFEKVDKLDGTLRAGNGFGSTGGMGSTADTI